MSEALLELLEVRRVFVQGGRRLPVLQGVSLRLRRGELVALLGPSGSGKSTLLHIGGLLERPDGGAVLIDGEPCDPDNDARRTALRARRLGFVYQHHHLLPEFSALENVVLPQLLVGRRRAAAGARAGDLLRQVGLGERLDHRPARLSGGEQQRVALARALANEPAVLLADEPTGNLDRDTAAEVMARLVELARRRGLAALVATHNLELARRMDRVLRLGDGRLFED